MATANDTAGTMMTRADVIEYCLGFNQAFEDKPFNDANWTVMRRHDTRRGFAWIFEREGHIWINVKCDPDDALAFRNVYASVIPAYHMNKKHWNSIILDGTVPDDEICAMIAASYALCAKR